MNDTELAQILARIQAGDNRTVDRVTMGHWKETIGHLTYADAMTAVVMHFRESTAYLLPAHVIANARRLREERSLRGAISESPDQSHPRPLNDAALIEAWNDAGAFQMEVDVYHRWLKELGMTPKVHTPILCDEHVGQMHPPRCIDCDDLQQQSVRNPSQFATTSKGGRNE